MLVAISGGPDSTALLLALRALGHDVVAAHYDHALRPDSAEDARHVAELCKGLGVELILERRSAPLQRGSIQAAGRAARYEFLERARVDARCELIATAHTADDLAETVAMNILRGTGTRGLRGIPEQNGPVVRPMLGTDRASVMGFLRERGVSARDDPSNHDLRFLRARVRALLLPASPGLTSSLVRVAQLARAIEDRLRAGGPDEPAARRAALQRLYAGAGGPTPGLSRAHLVAMDRLLTERRTGATLSLPGHLIFRVLPDARPEISSPSRPRSDNQLHERPCPGCADPDAVHLRPGALTLGTRRPGLRLRPAGGRGSRKLQDLLVDAKVPRHERDDYPLVFLDGDLAWVPGIAQDAARSTQKSLPGRHVWLGRSSTSPMVRSVD